MHELAEAAGLARHWRDVSGREQVVSDACLAAILDALGHPAESEVQIARSLRRLGTQRKAPPRMIVTETGRATPLPFAARRVELVAEDGAAAFLTVVNDELPLVAAPGYYTLSAGKIELTLAVAPRAFPSPADFGSDRLWGVGVQIPSLRSAVPSAYGTFAELDGAVKAFGMRGADAVAISPVHALFPGTGEDFSPYSPSSRLFLNGALAEPALCGLPPFAPREGGALIDWPGALPRRLADLRGLYEGLDPARRQSIARENEAQGEALRRHALFDALYCHFLPQGAKGWQDWPSAFHDPQGAAASDFARDHAGELAFHEFVQWLARKGMAKVQADARDAGMAVGLIADLAVGVRLDGSDAWAMRDAMLDGLTIGAPPDPLGPHGQNWNLTGFSPGGLAAEGYMPWIALLRASLASAGGLRIDHAFGLARLWVVPRGGSPTDGAYLTYPFEDLIRLAVLESCRAKALIIAEDLGTAPNGFVDAIARRRMLGMRVLWFERAADHGFIGGQDYPPLSVAMTGTHDTQTVAGWWKGRDLEWADKLGRLPSDVSRDKAEDIRDWDRGLLWSTIGDGGPRPAPQEPGPVVAAALSHISHSASQVAIAPLEDVLALDEQPNLPGTTVEHPNWRRRLDGPLEQMLEQPATAERIGRLARRERD